MAALTKQELIDMIKEQVAPLIKDTVGKDIADMVRENIETQLAPLRKGAKGGIVERMFSGNEEKEVEAPAGTNFAKCLRATAAAKMAGYGSEKAIEILRGWGDGKLADKWAEAREKALASNDPTSGGFLVPTQFSSDVIGLLRPAAVVRGLGATTIPMPNGTVKVPKVTQGASASYIGENSNAPKSEERFGQITLSFKKLACLVPISNDLIRYSSPAADAIVRDDVVRAMAQREDYAFLRDDGTSGTPKGLKNWINAANKFNANATVNLANVTLDLGKAVQALMAANIPMIVQQQQNQGVDARPGWIFSPRVYRYLTTLQTANGVYAFRDEMLRGTLWGWPYRVTTQVPETLGTGASTEIYFGAFAHAVIGEALGLQVDASMEAAYHDGSNVVAAFSQDQTVIRVIQEHDFALRYDKAFCLIEAVNWGV